MNVLRHWLEADEKPRCQHCPNLADERSFMCEDCSGQADSEAQDLRDQVEALKAALRWAINWIDFTHEIPVGENEQDDVERWKAAYKLAAALDEQRVAGVPTTTEIKSRSWNPKEAGRRAVEKHSDALDRLSDLPAAESPGFEEGQ